MKTVYALTISLSLFLMFTVSIPVSAQQQSRYASERQLSDLTQRFDSLEANWGRFQLGGSLSMAAASSFTNDTAKPIPNFTQQLSLDLDTYIDRSLEFSFKLSHQGGWGFSYQTIGSSGTPMIAPPQVDEAFIKGEWPNSLDYLGRFRFTLGPLGLISDFSMNPAEGVALQYKFGNYYLTGLYSRINTVYQPLSDSVTTSDDYFGARFGWSTPNVMLGLNLIPKGVTGERSFSLDIARNFEHSRFMAEMGWYSFHSAAYPNYQVDWTPGILVSYGMDLTVKSYLQMKLGYFGPQFNPSYSSLGHVAGDNREWFLPDSQGAEIDFQYALSKTLHWENRIAVLQPVSSTANQLYYHYKSALTQDFSAVNQLELALNLKSYPDSVIKEASLQWNLRF